MSIGPGHPLHDNGLRWARRRSLLAKMPKPKTKTCNRVKGVASRGQGKKWILILLVVVLRDPGDAGGGGAA
jgi:hypothetical protein